jgi:hypothetical protein
MVRVSTVHNRWALLLAAFACSLGTLALPGTAGATPSPVLAWTSTGPIDSTPPLGDGTHFQSVACPSATLCVAVDADGNVLTSTNPTGGSSTWQRSLVDPGTWFASISCPSASLCVAGDGDGNLVVSSDPTGGVDAWSKDSVTPGAVIDAITCPTTSFCVAGNQAGQVITSNDPTGGMASWSAKAVVAPD